MSCRLCTRARCSPEEHARARVRQSHSRTRTALESRSFSEDRGRVSSLILLARCLCRETRQSLRGRFEESRTLREATRARDDCLVAPRIDFFLSFRFFGSHSPSRPPPSLKTVNGLGGLGDRRSASLSCSMCVDRFPIKLRGIA